MATAAVNLPPGFKLDAEPSAPAGFKVDARNEPWPGIVQPTDMEAKILGDAGMGAVRGGRDVVQGTIRLGLKALRQMDMIDDETLASFEQHVEESQKAYDEKIRRNFGDSNFASKMGRIGGQVGMTSPVMALRLGSGAGLASRVATNAAQGAAAGAVLADPNNLARDTMTGAVAGAAVPEALRGALAGLGKTSSWLVSKRPQEAISGSQSAYGDLAPDVQDQLKAAGIDWQGLPEAIRRDVANWVRTNADKTAMTPEEAVRLGIFRSIGANPTKAMVTQKFDDFAQEDMLANQAGGEPIRKAQDAVNQAAGKSLMGLRSARGEGSEAGKSVVNILEGLNQQADDTIGKAYATAREAAGENPVVNMLPVKRTLEEMKRAAETSADGKAFWKGVRGHLKDIGLVDEATGAVRKLSVTEAEGLRQWLNSLPYNPGTYRFAAQIKNAVDDAVLATGKGGLFDEARFARRLKGSIFEDQAIVGKLLSNKKGSSVDRTIPLSEVFDTAVVKSTPEEFKQIVNTIRTSGQKNSELAQDDLRNAVLEWIEQSSRSAQKADGDGAIYLDTLYNKALKKIGNEKLDYLFGKESEALYRIGDALRLSKPIRGTTNPSGSGNRIIQFFQSYFPRMLGGGAGAAVGGPVGAAAGAAAADTVASGIRTARTGQRASTLLDPAKAIAKDRAVVVDLTGFAPRGSPSTVVGFSIRDWLNRQNEDQ